MTISMTKKIVILICGLIENLIFSGTIFGWPALFYMLKSEGIYEHLCHNVENRRMITTANTSLVEQFAQTEDIINEIDSNSSFIKKFSNIDFIKVNDSIFNDVQVKCIQKSNSFY